MAYITKTPVSALQELTVRQNYALPVYDLVHSNSGTHENTFHFKVQVDDQFAIGVGKSKKEAKHNSAEIMLDLLTNKGNQPKDRVVSVVKHDQVATAQKLVPVMPVLETQFFNLLQTMTPVSALQEFTVKQNHPLPVYDLVHSQSGTHDNTFYYQVQVRDYSAIGIGKSKKEAKHNAAQNLLDALTNNSKKLMIKSQDATDTSVNAPQNKFDSTFEASVKNLEDLYKDNHSSIQETNSVFPLEITTNSVGILQELAAKNKYPFPIYDLVYSKNGVNGDNIFHYKVTVQDDFAIGIAETTKDAKQAAAKNLLDLYAKKGKMQNDLQKSNKIFNLKELGVNLPPAPEKCGPEPSFGSLLQKKNFGFSQVLEDNSKTSISILQELMAKKNYPLPKYDLINSKSGTHDNSFNYQVQVTPDYVAVGGGKSKKEAKHNAAQKLLDLLAENGLYKPEKPLILTNFPRYQRNVETQSKEQIVHSKPCSPEVSRYSNNILYPADVPAKHKCISVKGTKLFATEDTFKSALSMCRSPPWDTGIMDVLPELKETCQREDMEIMDRDTEVQEMYNLLFNHQKMNLNTNVCEFENQFKNAMKEKEIVLETIQNYFQLPRTKDTLQQLLNEFEYTFSIEVMQDSPPISVLSIASDVPLMFMEMGDSLNEANAKVLDKAFTVLETFMLL